MNSFSSGNVWLRRQHCPCGDWKCFITYEREDTEDGSVPSQLGNKIDKTLSQDVVAPYVGMAFTSDDDAFEYYANFARKNGFSIRKERSRLSPQLGIYKRDFVCYRSGFAPPRKKATSEHQRDRKSMRCGCDAKMYLSKETVEGVSQWFVVQFSNVHNHELLEDEQVRLLPAYRKIQEADQERILVLSKAGLPIHRIVKILELEKGIHGGQLPFLERDVRNFIQSRKKAVQENGALLSPSNAMELLEGCKAMKEADENFVYDYTVDGNDKVEMIAWTYQDSVLLYSMYGDVVLFETTYESVTYGMTFGVWLGINNNGSTVLFGCVLLQDETPQSFSRALQTFLRFMNGKHPQTMITDLDPAVKDAIRGELSSTKHVISPWYILPKLSCWFSHLLGSSYADFRSEFEMLYGMESAEKFEYGWSQMVARFCLESEKHAALLFSFRESWAISRIRGYFLAQMTTRGYAKRVNMFLRRILSVPTFLRNFFVQVSRSASVQSQAYEAMQSMHIRTCIPIEEHARNILTPFAFSIFQHELVLAMQYSTAEMANGSCIVQRFKKTEEERLVMWIPESEQIHCSCKEFESSGILCRHALRVLITKNYFQLPEIYFLRRWQQIRYDGQTAESINDEWFQEFHDLTSTLFTESLMTKERSNFVRQELSKEIARLLHEVRGMPAHDEFAMDVQLSPTD